MKKILASVLVLTSLSCFSVMSSYAANEPMCYSNSSDIINENYHSKLVPLEVNSPIFTDSNSLYPSEANIVGFCYEDDNIAERVSLFESLFENFFNKKNKSHKLNFWQRVLLVLGPLGLLGTLAYGEHLNNRANSVKI